MEQGILVARKNNNNSEDFIRDQDLHSELAAEFEKLDLLADFLNVRRLSEFLDEHNIEADFYEEFHNGEEMPENWLEENQQWFNPEDCLGTIKQIIGYLEDKNKAEKTDLSDPAELVVDLRDCLKLIEIIRNDGDLFHFSPYVDV